MAEQHYSVIDFDGHISESISEMAEFMDPDVRQFALHPPLTRRGVFPSSGGAPGVAFQGLVDRPGRARKFDAASAQRRGSGEDWLGFLEKAEVERAVVFPSDALSVGFIQSADYAARICRAYNDYVADRYARVSTRIHPIALLPMQDITAAVQELRRAVKDLGLVGAMLPSKGLPLHLAHDYYWPLYEEAAKLDCPLGVHGGSPIGTGMDTFTILRATHGLTHSLPLVIALSALVYHGVLDRFPGLRLAFLEGGCAWVVLLADMEAREAGRDEGLSPSPQRLSDYVAGGRILIGCEGGSDPSLAYAASRVGIDGFAWASDYPHGEGLLVAQRAIRDTVERSDLSADEKRAVLGGNARRFFKLPAVGANDPTRPTADVA